LINPNTRDLPGIPHRRRDAELTKKLYRADAGADRRRQRYEQATRGALNSRQGLFNMTSDSGLFHTAAQLTAEGALREVVHWVGRDTVIWTPLYEAKMIDFFDHRSGSYHSRGDERGYRVRASPLGRHNLQRHILGGENR
jgi:hypothetical protein